MKLTSTVTILASPETVWDYLVTPSRYRTWNEQVIEFVPITQGSLAEGFTCRLRYRYGARESNIMAEVLEYEMPRRLVIHFTGGDFTRKGYALETYELVEKNGGSRLTQIVEMHAPGLGTLAATGMRLRHLFGRSDGKKGLRHLKKLIETSA